MKNRSFEEDFGDRMGPFAARNALIRGGFRGLARGKNVTFPPKNSPEREKIGEVEGGCWGKNGNKKGARSDLLRALFRVIIREILCASYFRRYQTL